MALCDRAQCSCEGCRSARKTHKALESVFNALGYPKYSKELQQRFTFLVLSAMHQAANTFIREHGYPKESARLPSGFGDSEVEAD